MSKLIVRSVVLYNSIQSHNSPSSSVRPVMGSAMISLMISAPSATMLSVMYAWCPASVFSYPGLYRVVAVKLPSTRAQLSSPPIMGQVAWSIR